MKQLRGPKHENWPVCDPAARCPACRLQGTMALKVVKMGTGHLVVRTNGAIGGPYCSPTWPSVFRRRCEPLVGRSGGFGGGAAPAPTGGAWGASSIRVPKKNARCPGLPELLPRKAWPGWLAELAPLFPGGGGGAKPLLFTTHKPCQMCKKKDIAVHARDQVVIARPPVLTPPWRYRRSLVSKGRFAISINVICVGIRSGLPKRRYRVVIYYVGAPLPPPSRQVRMLVVSWVMARVRIWENIELSVGFRGCCE
jgi:hypothetical protein